MTDNIDINKKTPLVTIGLMVYNEEKYIAETLESILQQDFSDYEIIIKDNASDDNTSKIAQDFANRNSKIRHRRHVRNIGALPNFNSLVMAANGKYFVLAAAHDLWSKNYLTALVEALEKTPDAVLAYARTVWIDEKGNSIGKPAGFIDTSGYNAVARFNLIMWSTHHLVYGLYRLSALRKTRIQLVMFGKLIIMLGELSVLGSFIVVPQATWYRRMNRKPETHEEKMKRYSTLLFSKKRKFILPHWGIPIKYFISILKMDVNFITRLALIMSIFSSLVLFSKVMIADVFTIFRDLGLAIKRPFSK